MCTKIDWLSAKLQMPIKRKYPDDSEKNKGR